MCDELPDIELVAHMAEGLYARHDGCHWMNLERTIEALEQREPSPENDETIAWVRAALAIAEEWSA